MVVALCVLVLSVDLLLGQATDGIPSLEFPDAISGVREWKTSARTLKGRVIDAGHEVLFVILDRTRILVNGNRFDDLSRGEQEMVLTSFNVPDRRGLFRALKKEPGNAAIRYYFAITVKTQSGNVCVPVDSLLSSPTDRNALTSLQRSVIERMKAIKQRKEEVAAQAKVDAALRSLANSKRTSTTGTSSLSTYRFTVYKWVSKSRREGFPEIVQAGSEQEAMRIVQGRHSGTDVRGEKVIITLNSRSR